MPSICRAVALATLLASLLFTSSGALAVAQEHRDNHHYVEHKEWKKGYRMRDEDWRRGERVDWKRYRLSEPPRGYEWRMVDGNYVLAAVATGVIASVVAAATIH